MSCGPPGTNFKLVVENTPLLIGFGGLTAAKDGQVSTSTDRLALQVDWIQAMWLQILAAKLAWVAPPAVWSWPVRISRDACTAASSRVIEIMKKTASSIRLKIKADSFTHL